MKPIQGPPYPNQPCLALGKRQPNTLLTIIWLVNLYNFTPVPMIDPPRLLQKYTPITKDPNFQVYLGGIVTEMKHVMSFDFVSCKLSVCKRDCNKVAHNLAALGCPIYAQWLDGHLG